MRPLRFILVMRWLAMGWVVLGASPPAWAFWREPASVSFARIDSVDALMECPLETLPPDLSQLLSTLDSKVKNSIAKMQTSVSSHCEELEKRLSLSSYKLNTLVLQGIISAQVQTQSAINRATLQATATQEVLFTISDLFSSSCLQKTEDRVIIQRLVAQMMTIGGIYTGGWQGLSMAASGQFLGSLPLFQSEFDQALDFFRKYDDENERGAFLCIYRQMQKTHCQLFPEREDEVVAGVDLTGKTGPYQKTQESIEELKQKDLEGFQSIVTLAQMVHQGEPFLGEIERSRILPQSWSEGLTQFFHWCQLVRFSDFKDLGSFPHSIEEHILSLKDSCLQVEQYEWGVFRQGGLVQFLLDSYLHLLELRTYYEALRTGDSKLSFMASTYESLRYFETLFESLKKMKDSSLGNQFRMNYHFLVEGLGNSLALKSFRGWMKDSFSSRLDSHSWAKKRGLFAALESCRTFDPSLVCLYPNPNKKSALLEEWKKWCLGPQSRVCQALSRLKDLKELGLENSPDFLYYQKLCEGQSKKSSSLSSLNAQEHEEIQLRSAFSSPES